MTRNEEIKSIQKTLDGKRLWMSQTDGRKIQGDVSMCVRSIKFAQKRLQ
jgi:hypothetical protein